jgi:hypothetical protein
VHPGTGPRRRFKNCALANRGLKCRHAKSLRRLSIASIATLTDNYGDGCQSAIRRVLNAIGRWAQFEARSTAAKPFRGADLCSQTARHFASRGKMAASGLVSVLQRRGRLGNVP